MRSHALLFTCIGLIVPIFPSFAGTISFNQLVVFGDSLSDNGNAALFLGGTIPGNYAPNAFTDGANTSPATTGPFGLWVDQFAALAGVPDPQPALANLATNTNYAIASAQTGSANPQDITNQLALFLATHPAGASASPLYVVWGGANDIYNGTNTGKAAADSLFLDIEILALKGGRNFLWLNLPQLGDTPRGASSAAALNSQSTAFDTEWAADLATLNGFGLNAIGVDINTEFNQILANPASFGFTDVKDPAQGIAGNPNQYLFWDTMHPTTAGDALVAQTAYLDVFGTPEPGSLALLLGGISGLFVFGRRRRA